MISLCCVGLVSFMWFTMNLIIMTGILVCSSFLISVCIFIVLKALLITSVTLIVRAGVAIWLNPLLPCCLLWCGPRIASLPLPRYVIRNY